MTTLSEEETLSLNISVLKYLTTISDKLAAKFKKEFSLDEERDPTDDDANTSISLEEMVKRHQAEDVKRKRKTAEDGDEDQTEVKKS